MNLVFLFIKYSNMNLLPGERIDFADYSNFMNNLYTSEEEINQKYIKGEVRIVTEQARYPLPSIMNMLESGSYALNPEFQRRHRWNTGQKSKLIESFIMNVPIPPIFLYEDSYSHYEVMDGLQRLTAIYEFYKNKFPLEGLTQWPELNGKTYDSLPLQIKRGIDRRYLSSIILLQETAKNDFEAVRLKQLVFERINSGGVNLEPQESRNAVYNGPLNELCLYLSRNTFLCRTWDIPEPDNNEMVNGEISDELLKNPYFQKMEDVELVLRFFANRQREEIYKIGNRRFRDFLDAYLRQGNKFSPNVLGNLKYLFEETIEFVYELLGEKAFWLYRNRNNHWNWFSRPTTAIYDPLMLVASEFLEYKENILLHRDTIENVIINFYIYNYDSFEGRNTNPSVVRERDRKFSELFRSLI